MEKPQILERFASSSQTLKWSEEAYGEFRKLCQDFFDSENNAREQVVEFDPEYGDDVVKLKFQHAPSDRMIRAATETILHSEHGIDQALVAACKCVEPSFKRKPSFPWSENEKDFEARIKTLLIQLHDFLRKARPYYTNGQGSIAQDQVRALAKVANKKHSVNLTVCLTNPLAIIDARSAILTSDLFAQPVWDGTKNEMHLFRIVHGSKYHDETTYSFDIALNEGWPLENERAAPLFNMFGIAASQIANGLASTAAEATK